MAAPTAATYVHNSLVVLMAHFPQRQNDHGIFLRPTRWPPSRVIIVNFMWCSSHLGQVLLHSQMPPPVLFLNLDDARASSEDILERGFNSSQ